MGVWFAVAIGGAVGSTLRHGVNKIFSRWVTTIPVATMTVNVTGCFIIGLLAGLLAADRISLRFYWREFVFVGVLGGYTTFSTFGLDTFLLERTHSWPAALANIAIQVIGGLAAVWAGHELGLRA